jgi:hypothetical protein
MYYKEFLRVRNCFIAFALILVAIAVLVALLSGHAKLSMGDPAPKTVSTRYVVAADKGEQQRIQAPGIVISNEPNEPFPFSALLALAGFVAAIFASVVGTSLGCENAGHLEIAWTRPASRIMYAANLMAMDVAGIFATFAFTLALSIGVTYAAGWQHYLAIDADAGANLVRFLAYGLAWFALVWALTASVRGKTGAYAGFSWIGAAILLLLLDLSLPKPLHTLIAIVNYANPFLYGSYSSGAEAAHRVIQMSATSGAIGLMGITVAGIVAALAQWRRLET